MKEEFKAIDTNKRSLKKFGLLIGGVLLGLTFFVIIVKNGNIHLIIPIIALLFIGLGIFVPHTLKIFYQLWMGIAIILGVVVGNTLLTFFYFLVMTPIGPLKRFFRRSMLRKKESYWICASTFKKESLEQPF